MELHKMVDQRRSVRTFSNRPVEQAQLDDLKEFIKTAKPLYPGIKVEIRIVSNSDVRFYLPWKSQQLLAVFSENKPGYLENAGFLLQQVDLYLQSHGIGSCWLGLGKLRNMDIVPENMDFVILMAFGHTKQDFLRTNPSQFKRKTMEDISDIPDDRLEPARLAPSSTNSQPWYFVHDGDVIHAYRNAAGERRHKMLGYMNKIDMGIALSHLYVANAERFHFVRDESAPAREGLDHIGSVRL